MKKSIEPEVFTWLFEETELLIGSIAFALLKTLVVLLVALWVSFGWDVFLITALIGWFANNLLTAVLTNHIRCLTYHYEAWIGPRPPSGIVALITGNWCGGVHRSIRTAILMESSEQALNRIRENVNTITNIRKEICDDNDS